MGVGEKNEFRSHGPGPRARVRFSRKPGGFTLYQVPPRAQSKVAYRPSRDDRGSTRQRFRALRVLLLQAAAYEFAERENRIVADPVKNLQALFPSRQHAGVH